MTVAHFAAAADLASRMLQHAADKAREIADLRTELGALQREWMSAWGFRRPEIAARQRVIVDRLFVLEPYR